MLKPFIATVECQQEKAKDDQQKYNSKALYSTLILAIMLLDNG